MTACRLDGATTFKGLLAAVNKFENIVVNLVVNI
jgi:hypothetical protein